MCGIFGFFNIENTGNRTLIDETGRRMLDTLRHRGPDAGHLWQDPDLPLLLGHSRLSIIDLSPCGAQPMVSRSGRYVISYNGEIYNFRKLQDALLQKGVAFQGHSDTEILLEAISYWGLTAALEKISGMYALALWDRQEKKLHLARDPMGKKPLYAGYIGKNPVFASELKAFHAYDAAKLEVNRDALASYMRYGYVCAPYSIYRNIWQLLPGSYITLDPASGSFPDNLEPAMKLHRNPAAIAEKSRSSSCKNMPDDELTAMLDNKLNDAVRRRMIADVPLGAFLSGGIDSSAVVSIMQKNSDVPVKTFTIGYDEAGFNEAGHAGMIAGHLGTDHHEMFLTPEDVRKVIPSLPEIYDEPFADMSQIPTFLISKFAREHVTVALSGDGGDEMFAGYLRHYKLPALWQKIGWMPPGCRRTLGKMIEAVPSHRWDRLMAAHPHFGIRLYKMAALAGKENIEDAYKSLLTLWPAPEDLVMQGREPFLPLDDPARYPENLDFAEKMVFGDTLSYLPNDVLTKVDRASMACSLEVRSPLLDQEIFEFAWSVPMQTKIRNGQGKWLLQEVLKRYIPASLFERPKQGFEIPLRSWLNGPLREWAEDLLSEDTLRRQGYLDADIVRRTWAAYQTGQEHLAGRIWAVLMFQSWLDRWHR